MYILREHFILLQSFGLSQVLFKKAVKTVKLMKKRAMLEQQIKFLSICLSTNVFPSSVWNVNLPNDLRNDWNLRRNIMTTLVSKLRRLVYARKARCSQEESENTNSLREILHPSTFEAILQAAQAEYVKEVTSSGERCHKKYRWLSNKQSTLNLSIPTRSPPNLTQTPSIPQALHSHAAIHSESTSSGELITCGQMHIPLNLPNEDHSLTTIL
jgi:hypothetical protein